MYIEVNVHAQINQSNQIDIAVLLEQMDTSSILNSSGYRLANT